VTDRRNKRNERRRANGNTVRMNRPCFQLRVSLGSPACQQDERREILRVLRHVTALVAAGSQTALIPDSEGWVIAGMRWRPNLDPAPSMPEKTART